jgi:non-ribosomal peptide synthetase component F
VTSTSLLSPLIQSVAPLTSEQLFLLGEGSAGSPAAGPVVQRCLALRGPINPELMAAALQLTIVRHAALRGLIVYRHVAQPVQAVLAQRQALVETVDLSGLDAIARGRQAAAWQERDRRRSFDPQSDPLLRLTLIRRASGQALALWSYHPVVLDDWSFPTVVATWLTDYEQLLAGANRRTLALQAQAQDRAAPSFHDWVRSHQRQTLDREHWAALADPDRPPSRPAALTPAVDGGGSVTAEDSLSPDGSARCAAAAARLGLTLAAYVGAAWGLVLQRATGQSEAVFARVRSGRGSESVLDDHLVGCCADTIPVLVQTAADDSIRSFAARVAAQDDAQARRPRCDWPPAQRLGGSGLAGTVYRFQDNPLDDAALSAIGRLQVRLEASRPAGLAACQAEAAWVAGRLCLRVDCDPPYVRRDAERILDWWADACEALDGAADQPLAELDLSPRRERRQLLEDFNPPVYHYPDQGLARLVSEQAAAAPDAVALVAPGRSLTRDDLDRAARRTAARLADAGLARGDRATVSGPRSAELVATVLACARLGLECQLKAGDSAVEVVGPNGGETLVDQSIWADDAPAESGDPDGPSDWDDASGLETPGEPGEAAGGPQDGFAVVRSHSETLVLSQRALVSLGLNPSVDPLFDHEAPRLISVNPVGSPEFWVECLVPLLRGHGVILPQADDLADAGRFLRLAWDAAATVLVAGPDQLRRLTDRRDLLGSLTGLRQVVVPGPDHPTALVQRLALYTAAGWWRAHTPAGAVLWATLGPISPAKADLSDVGRPLANTQVYVLDRLRPCGIGQVGELCLAGDSLPQAAPDRPTEANPFGPGLLLRTGEAARWLPDGQLGLAPQPD